MPDPNFFYKTRFVLNPDPTLFILSGSGTLVSTMALLSLGMLIDHNFKRPSSLNRKNWFGEELFSSLVLLLKKKKFWNDMNYTGWPVFRSNQQAQADLQQLRQDINDFVQSVLANPENKGKALSVR